ncbi:MAG: nucleoside hydrolase [Armatimonadota bacterium]|nr:nucleoside hydrolase [Armatimonadota bacterium]
MSLTFIVLVVIVLAIGEVSAAPRKVIISTDIGDDIDDAFAVAFALKSPELKVDAIVATHGPTARRAKLAARLLSIAGREDIPVLVGKPGEDYDQGQLRWAAGFTPKTPVVSDGPRALADRVMRSREKVIIVPTGPLTDVAEMLKLEPKVKEKIEEIVLMGGSIYRDFHYKPQPCPETNIVLDAKAARTVFESGIPITMAPLDVTVMMQPDPADMKRLAESKQPLAHALHELFVAWGHPIPTFYDPVAVAVILQRDMVKTERLCVKVTNDGFTRVAPGEEPNANVCLEVDKPRFMKLFMGRILGD